MNTIRKIRIMAFAMVLAMGWTAWLLPPAKAARTDRNRPEDIPEEITIYAIDAYYEDYLTIPGELPQSWSFGNHQVARIDGDSVELDGNSTVRPSLKTWYCYQLESGWWVQSQQPTGREDEVVRTSYDYSDTILLVDGAWEVTVHLAGYAAYHAERVVADYLAENVTEGMSQYQIAELCCQFVAGYDYSAEAADMVGMITTGGGDCWASTRTLLYMLRSFDILCASRNAGNDPGAGGQHINVIAQLDGVYYILETGYDQPAPRPYDMTKLEVASIYTYSKVRTDGAPAVYITGLVLNEEFTELVIPGQIDGYPVTGIADGAFQGNDSIHSVTLPDTLRYLGENAFRNCENLEQINLPEGLKTMGSACFSSCEALKQVTIPSTVERLSSNMFYGCYSLTAIDVAPDHQTYASQDGVLFDKSMETLISFPGGKGDYPYVRRYDPGETNRRAKALSRFTARYTVPEGVKTILASAFAGVCIGKLELPDSVTALEPDSFYSARVGELILSDGITVIPAKAFENAVFQTLTLPASLERIEDYAFYRGEIRTELMIPDGVTYIGDYAFAGHLNEVISIPDSVKEIGTGAFQLSYGWASMGGLGQDQSRGYTGAVFLGRDCKPQVLEDGAFGGVVLCVYPDSDMHRYALEQELLWYPRGADGTIALRQEWLTGTEWVGTNHLGVYEQRSNAYTGGEVLPYGLRWQYGSEDGTAPFSMSRVHLVYSYSDPVNIGTCTISITGTGLLSGRITTQYDISPADPYAELIDRSGCGLQYRVKAEQIEIVSYIASALDEKLTIPETMEGLPVTTIGQWAFRDCTILRDVILPPSVTKVDYNSFRRCDSLEAIWFTGDMPLVCPDAFSGGTCYYPADNATWDLSRLRDDGADKWLPMCTTPGMHHSNTQTLIPPSCTGEGYTAHTCTDCGFVEQTDFVPKLDHAYEASVTPPTCREEGYTTHTCICGDSYVDEYVDATGHQYGEAVVLREPTCYQHGLARQNCIYCDYDITPRIPATGHQFDSVVTAPTCTNSGYTTRTCTACLFREKTDVVEALGHDFAYGVCSRCALRDDAWEPGHPFTDLAQEQWYYVPVLWAVDQGITSGTTATTFAPDQTCIRAQVVTFLWRAMGEPAPENNDNPFTDVREGAYYYDAVLWAVEQGITSGTSPTTFAPDKPCTRDQVVTFLHRTMGKPVPGQTDNPFTDVSQGAYYYNAVLWAVEQGITSGVSASSFAPGNPCTRAQVVTFLYRTMKNNTQHP